MGSSSGMVAPIAQTLLAGNMEPIVVAPPTRPPPHNAAMTIDLTSLPAVGLAAAPGSAVEASQTGSVNMQLAGYHPNPGGGPGGGGGGGQAFITAAGPTFPFTLSTTTAGGLGPSEAGGSGHPGRTVADRGEESPMVGVCVQQSPVASH